MLEVSLAGAIRTDRDVAAERRGGEMIPNDSPELDDALDTDAQREWVRDSDRGFQDRNDMLAKAAERIEYFDSPDAALPARPE